jgi:hypothetical protein
MVRHCAVMLLTPARGDAAMQHYAINGMTPVSHEGR